MIPKLRGLIEVSAGNCFTCALDRKGVVWCWGKNEWGALGRPPEAPCDGPAPVVGLPPIVHITSDGELSCALDREGAVYCWGSENLYQAPEQVALPCRLALPRPAIDVEVVQHWGVTATLDDGRELRWNNLYYCDDWYRFEYEVLPSRASRDRVTGHGAAVDD